MVAQVLDTQRHSPSSTGHYTNAAPDPSPSTPLQRVARAWFAVRYELTRTVFGRPLPFLTERLGLKLGDVIVTLPLAAVYVAMTASKAAVKDVAGSGGPAMGVMIITILLAVRNNAVLLTATGLPYERALYYHRFFGAVAWIAAALHGLSHLYKMFSQPASERVGATGPGALYRYGFPVVISGAVMFYCFTLLVAFSFYKIRRRFFELFLRTHWILFLAIVAFGVVHGAPFLLVGVVPMLLDALYRYAIQAPRYARNGGAVHTATVELVAGTKDLVRVQWPRARTQGDRKVSFEYAAGQYVFLCVPSLSLLQWHPFTIASAPHEPMVTIYIKVLGDWTSQLACAAAVRDNKLRVLVEGPYGAESIDLHHYSHFVFVSGGIGVTPMMAIANGLFHESQGANTRLKPVRKAWFVWSVRDRETVQALLLDDEPLQATPRSWLPHAILSPSYANSRERDPFVTEIYLTKGTQDLSHPVDQRLALSLQYGRRPNIGETLRCVGEHAVRDGANRVGVLVCGPDAMITEVIVQSQRVANELQYDVAFDVHQETFDF